MNAAARDAVEQALANVEDDLYRYKTAAKAAPGSLTGNGEPYENVIAKLEERAANLREALDA